jgi:predicted phage baseplate assembly protein
MGGLCGTGATTTRGCCAAAAVAVEIAAVYNPPGRSSLRYRPGTFATIRRALLARIPERLPHWTDRSARDYGVALLDMWATLADVLTFYHERIANESFLSTAVLRDSIVRLAGLVDYRPNPGGAAGVYLSFRADAGKVADLPQGFRVQTKPAPRAPPVKFETDEPLTVHASLNVLRARSLQPQTFEIGDTIALLKGTKTRLSPGDHILIVGDERENNPASERWDVRQLTSVTLDKAADITTITWRKGLGNDLKEDLAAARQKRASVPPAAHPRLFALRVEAWPFGYNAPDFDSLQVATTQTITGEDNKTRVVKSVSTPKLKSWKAKKLPENVNHAEHLFLDSIYPEIVPGGWVAVATAEEVDLTPAPGMSHPEGYVRLYKVTKAEDTTHTGYTLTAKVSRLTIDTVAITRGGVTKREPQHIKAFPMQGSAVLGQSEELTLANVPVTAPVTGDTITLDAIYPDLRGGRLLIASGRLFGSAETQSEVVRVKDVAVAAGATVITMTAALRYEYDAASFALGGNVAPASHGETVAREILGSGDGARLFQTFALKHGPLTFLREPGPRANRWGTRPALEVRVDSVRWEERETLLDSGPSDRHYVVSVDAADGTSVTFGAGGGGAEAEQGAGAVVAGGSRLPTARDNVRATYRKGLGLTGNVDAGTVSTLVSSALGLRSVTNPIRGSGGADRERDDEIKTNVPAAMRAFDRAVSLEDYAALARAFAGVAKARATWEHRDPSDPWGRSLERPRIHLTVAATDRTPPLQPMFKRALRDFLDERRDRNQPLFIGDFTPVTVHLEVEVEPDADRLPEVVVEAVRRALSSGRNPDGSFGLFAFERLDFGVSLHLSDVYAAVQAVPGVRAARIPMFHHETRDATEAGRTIDDVETHVLVRGSEIVRCDGDPADPSRGTLAVTAREILGDAN